MVIHFRKAPARGGSRPDLTGPAGRRAGLLLLLLGLWAGGCHPRDGRPETKDRELMRTSFEELAYCLPEVPPSLSTAKAHTGRYALRVQPGQDYSITYRSRLGALSGHRPRRFTLSAWAWVPNFESDAMLVASISHANDSEHPIFTKYLYLNDSGPYETWKPVARELELPGDLHADDQLVIYLWRVNAPDPVYVDDVLLTELW